MKLSSTYSRKSLASSLLSLLAIQAFSSVAMAATSTPISNFYQDWKLDPAQGSGSGCAQSISAYQGDDVPGTQGMPHLLDPAASIRFVPDDTEAPEVFTIGVGPTTLADNGTVTVSDSNNVLSIVDQTRAGLFFWKMKTIRSESYSLLPNGALVIANQTGKQSSICSYLNSYPEKVGMVEVGAVLMNNGAKVAECTFVSASPRADQVNFAYTEKCSFGKFTVKTVINDVTEVISSELVANDNATHELEIVRSSSLLNNETENYLSRDTEIAVENSDVDDVSANIDEYYFSPYRTSAYAIPNTHAVVQIQYARAGAN